MEIEAKPNVELQESKNENRRKALISANKDRKQGVFFITILTLSPIGNDFDIILGGNHDGQHQQCDHDVRSGNHVTDESQHNQEARYERTEHARLLVPKFQRPAAPLSKPILDQWGHLEAEIGVLPTPKHHQTREEEDSQRSEVEPASQTKNIHIVAFVEVVQVHTEIAVMVVHSRPRTVPFSAGIWTI